MAKFKEAFIPSKITISTERYEQLIKAEALVEICKNAIMGKLESYNYDNYFSAVFGIKDGENNGAE